MEEHEHTEHMEAIYLSGDKYNEYINVQMVYTDWVTETVPCTV